MSERSFGFFKPPLLDGYVTQTCQRVHVVRVPDKKFLKVCASAVEIACGALRITLPILDVASVRVKYGGPVKVRRRGAPFTFAVISVRARQDVRCLFRFQFNRAGVFGDRAIPVSNSEILSPQK